MNRTLVDRIVNAVLYEGYILYPYRPSVKNRHRWTFGGLYPQSYSLAQNGTDAWSMQTECLVRGDAHTAVHIEVRFLHLRERRVGELPEPARELPAGGWRFVPALRTGDRLYHPWQEAVERTVDVGEAKLGDLATTPRRTEFAFPSGRELEPLPGPSGEVVGVLVREQQAVAGAVGVAAERVAEGLFKLTVRIQNQTAWDAGDAPNRDEAQLRALVSTHTILGVREGEFVSLLDPPDEWRGLAAGCRNLGAWPVLVGEDGARDTILSSPIILYDYPQVAPESPGDLFDATEIDEILTLRILTLTDEEKREAAAVDERARSLLQRTEALAREQLLGLHGTVRGLRPVEEKCHD